MVLLMRPFNFLPRLDVVKHFKRDAWPVRLVDLVIVMAPQMVLAIVLARIASAPPPHAPQSLDRPPCHRAA